jgi:hypothetical protein
VRQRFDVPSAIDDVPGAVREAWSALEIGERRALKGEVAVAVGSRGIDRIDEIVAAVVDQLKKAGCRPFIVPAMGSHGGGTAEGQVAVLESLGISQARSGAPIRASMDVAQLGSAAGVPLYVDRTVLDADGIVLVNRVKPHTDFAGPLGSGLLKMLCVGLGKQVGAELYHRAAMNVDLGELIRVCGHALLDALPVHLGVAILENQEHRVCDLSILPGERIEERELQLQEQARRLLPTLPLDEIDLLIVNEMGKDISGAGMDPNVTGRTVGAWSVQRASPSILRIFARALSPASHGNACGLGYVDVATPRLIEAIDLEATALNAVTSYAPEDARLPLTVPTERDAIAVALATVGPHTADDVRIVQIRNTSSLRQFLVSEGCLPALRGRENIDIDEERLEFGFDSRGRLISPLDGGERSA